MIAVSVQIKSPLYQQFIHFALPPIGTDDFNVACDITQNYMNRTYPNMFYTINMTRHDYATVGGIIEDQQAITAVQEMLHHRLN